MSELAVDRLQITILPDGTIKTETKSFVSKANHDNAEGFLRAMAQLAGGETTREKIAKPALVHDLSVATKTEVKA